jgi:hypothetical protein
LPVSGLMLAPLVEPKDEPSMFEETRACRCRSGHPANPADLPFNGLRPRSIMAARVHVCDEHCVLASDRGPAIGLVGEPCLWHRGAVLQSKIRYRKRLILNSSKIGAARHDAGRHHHPHTNAARSGFVCHWVKAESRLVRCRSAMVDALFRHAYLRGKPLWSRPSEVSRCALSLLF